MRETIQLNPEAKALLLGDNKPSILEGCQAVLHELTGQSGLFANHLSRGQSKWPALSPGWVKRKRTGEKFVHTGRVKTAITQSSLTLPGQLLAFGSSADIHAGGMAGQGQIRSRFTSKGIYVDVKLTRGAVAITVGFVGNYVKSAAFKKFEKGLWDDNVRLNAAGRLEVFRRAQRLRGTNERKHRVQGSRGYVKGPGGKSQMVLARGDENLAYANVLQRGQFLGIKEAETGTLFNPRAVAAARKRGTPVKGTAQWGAKTMPLLPAESGDVARLAAAFERGLQTWCANNGWTP